MARAFSDPAFPPFLSLLSFISPLLTEVSGSYNQASGGSADPCLLSLGLMPVSPASEEGREEFSKYWFAVRDTPLRS